MIEKVIKWEELTKDNLPKKNELHLLFSPDKRDCTLSVYDGDFYYEEQYHSLEETIDKHQYKYWAYPTFPI